MLLLQSISFFATLCELALYLPHRGWAYPIADRQQNLEGLESTPQSIPLLGRPAISLALLYFHQRLTLSVLFMER